MRGFKLIDLLAALAMVLVVGTLTLAQAMFAGETADRVKCASNLRQIGQAMLLYANDNRGSYPRTIWDGAEDPRPTWGTPYQADPSLGADQAADPFAADGKPGAKERPAANDVTAALFLLLRAGDITPEVMVCPSTDAERWDMGGGTNTAQSWTNFAGEKNLALHLSYSLNNPYFSAHAIRDGANWTTSASAEYAIASDMNPGSDALLKLSTQSPAAEMRQGNSLNHDQDGQNVLFGDGHVEFDQNPLVGAMRDNIFTVQAPDQPVNDRSASASLIGASISATDSVLLPTAKSIGAVGTDGRLITSIPVNPLTPAEAAEIQPKLLGTYDQDPKGPSARFMAPGATLTIDQTTISESRGPVTVTYSYQIQSRGGPWIGLLLTAPDTPPAQARIQLTSNGVAIAKIQFLSGQWVHIVTTVKDPQETSALKKQIIGNYVGIFNGRKAHLNIDDKDFTTNAGPMTMKFAYEIEGTAGKQIRLNLIAPQTPILSLSIDTAEHGIHISGSNGFDGD